MPVSPETALAITSKKARYGRYVDLKQWDRFAAEVALPDCQMTYLDLRGDPLRVGKTSFAFGSTADFCAFFGRFFGPLQTLHIIGPGDFSETGRLDEVKAVFAFEDEVLMPPLGAWAEVRGGGYYSETWKRNDDGGWFMKDLVMQRTYQKEALLVKIGLLVQNVLGLQLF